MHVAQEAEGSSEVTVLEAVMAADLRAKNVQSEIDTLEGALASADPQQLAAAAAGLRTAAVVPGEAEEAVQQLLAERYEQLADLEDTGAAEARAATILKGLGFSREAQGNPTSLLSGGWRMRVALAAALFAAPDVLCLDEPTNHLDLESILWLQNWLQNVEDQTLLVVSHDRAFLSAVTQETIILKDKQLRYFPGPYDAFVEAQSAAVTSVTRKLEALQKQKKHIEASIAAAEKAARSAGDDKKLQQAASRKKKLAERHGAEKSESGHRFKLSRDRIGYFTSKRPEVVLERQERPFNFKWPQPAPLRQGGPLMQLHQVCYCYSGSETPVLQHVTFDIHMNSRIALLGPNGAGKSTLLQLISGKLQPHLPAKLLPSSAAAGGSSSGGKIKVIAKNSSSSSSGGKGLGLSSKAQKMSLGEWHSVSGVAVAMRPSSSSSSRGGSKATTASKKGGGSGSSGGSGGSPMVRSDIPEGYIDRHPNLKVGYFGQHCVEELQLDVTALEHLSAVCPGMRDQEARDYLGSFGLGGRLSTEQPLRSLSGGQKARMALALVLYPRPNLLLLDEPTNHLDMETIEALATAVRGFSGAVVLVSHDVWFMGDVIEGGAEGEGGTGDAEEDQQGELWLVGGGRVASWDREGGLKAYVAKVMKAVIKAG